MYQHNTAASRWHRIRVLAVITGLTAALVAFTAPASATNGEAEAEAAETFIVTVENLTDNQTLTPAVVAAHENGFRLFRNHRPASNGLQQLAENGGVPVLVDELNGNDHVTGLAVAGDAPIPPGGSASTLITATGSRNRVSVAAMLI